MSWRLAESLKKLREQLNAAFPKRSKASDGSIGDERHSARTSDHNPNEKGVVCAIDVTNDPDTGIGGQWLADTLVRNKDPRIKYIIWNKQICSSKTSPWKWRPYHGANAHQHHVHISVDADPKLYDSRATWKLDFPVNGKSDVAKISTAEDANGNSASKKDVNAQNPVIQPAEDPAGSQPSITQTADTIVNTGDQTNTPPPEDKVMNAPPKDGATATSTKMTIAGIVVPGFVVAFIQGLKQLINDGYVSASDIGSTVLTFIRENQKYVFLLIALLIVLLIIKKIIKTITFWLTVISQMVPQFNNIHVTGDKSVEPPSPWWQFWKA